MEEPEVKFYDHVDDALLKYAVIIAKYQGKWVFCRHRDRDTLEVPGGRREPGETILETAGRELAEETGALEFTLAPVCAYSFRDYGMLYYGEITALDGGLHHEIREIYLMDNLPDRWTYPMIQPKLMEEARRRGVI